MKEQTVRSGRHRWTPSAPSVAQSVVGAGISAASTSLICVASLPDGFVPLRLFDRGAHRFEYDREGRSATCCPAKSDVDERVKTEMDDHDEVGQSL